MSHLRSPGLSFAELEEVKLAVKPMTNTARVPAIFADSQAALKSIQKSLEKTLNPALLYEVLYCNDTWSCHHHAIIVPSSCHQFIPGFFRESTHPTIAKANLTPLNLTKLLLPRVPLKSWIHIFLNHLPSGMP